MRHVTRRLAFYVLRVRATRGRWQVAQGRQLFGVPVSPAQRFCPPPTALHPVCTRQILLLKRLSAPAPALGLCFRNERSMFLFSTKDTPKFGGGGGLR